MYKRQAIKFSWDLSDKQYGFRKMWSTLEAVNIVVVEAARVAERENHFSLPMYLLVIVDVKNAINSAKSSVNA